MSNIGYTPQNEKTIAKDVAAEIEAQVRAATTPMEGQIRQLEERRDDAAGEISGLFDVVTGGATESAARIREGYTQAQLSEQAIMGEARDRLNNLRQERAAEAQRLAQQIGAPVPVEEFTSPVDLEGSLFSAASAGSLLKGSGLAEAGVQHAEAFAGRVLPLMRAREIAATRSAFDSEIRGIRDEITAIKASKGGLISEGRRQRLLEEREFALQRATANRDWTMAKQSAKLEAERLRLQATEIYGQDVTYDKKSGTYTPKKGGAPTLAGKELGAAQKVSRQAAIEERRAAAFDLVEAVMNPGAEEVETTQFVPVADGTVSGAFWNGNMWVRAITVKDRITRPPITNPNEVINFLVGKGIPRTLAESTVKKRFPGWTPGTVHEGSQPKSPTRPGSDRPQYTHKQLRSMSPTQVIKIARSLGFQQKVPPSILKYGTREIPNPNYGNRADPSNRQRTITNPNFDKKKYNELVKNFYIYWVQRIYADDRGAPYRDRTTPGKGD